MTNTRETHFFFRPLLAANRSWSAFEWQTGTAENVSAADFTDCLGESGAVSLAKLRPLVLPAEPDWITQGEFIQKFDADQAVFVLPQAAMDSAQLIERCSSLRKKGYHFALRVSDADTIKSVPLAAFDHLHFTADFARHVLPAEDMLYVADAGLRKIAAEVLTADMFDWLAARKFALCDSRFVTSFDPSQGNGADLTRLKLFKLLNLVATDADTREIEQIFREEAKLSYNLLRLVNSVAVGAKTTISSFHQAIAVLGRRQLQRWVQLLIYAEQMSSSNAPNPLMLLAAARGRQMELLSSTIAVPPDIPDFGDAAFMTGIFSLLDVLLKMPMNEILEALPLQSAIAEALRSRGGIIGDLLAIVIAGESGDHATAEERLARLQVSPMRHAMAQTAALFWASRINLD